MRGKVLNEAREPAVCGSGRKSSRQRDGQQVQRPQDEQALGKSGNAAVKEQNVTHSTVV